MYKKALTGTLLLVTAFALQADPAVYRDGQLTIPEGAVVSESGNAYFTDITLGLDADGNFTITGADTNQLVHVGDVEALVMESFPVQVSLAVSGTLSVPCKELLPPAIAMKGNTFNVVLAESNLGPAESCITIVEPFDTTIPLDVEGLPAGTYEVDVNGVSATFTLEMDNTPVE